MTDRADYGPTVQEKRHEPTESRSQRSSRRSRGLFVVIEYCGFGSFFFMIRGHSAADPNYARQVHAPSGVERDEALLICRELGKIERTKPRRKWYSRWSG